MKKENNIVLPIIFIVLLIIGIGVIIGDKVLENNNKEEQHYEEKQEVKEDIEEKVDISTPTLSKDKIEKDVLKYIKDEDYEVVSVYSKDIKELYEKYTYNKKIMDNYLEEKITNDMVITLSLQEYDKINLSEDTYENLNFFENNPFYKRVCTQDEYNLEWEICRIIYPNEKLDIYVKKLFGDKIQYDITKYSINGVSKLENCCYYRYSKEDKSMVEAFYGTGCGVEEHVENSIEYAYKKDDKLVIIEKSLFFASDIDTIDGTSKSYKATIYNNVKKEKLLAQGEEVGNCNSTEKYDYEYCLTKYKDDVSYYAYTFLQNEDGSYYLADFSRLK